MKKTEGKKHFWKTVLGFYSYLRGCSTASITQLTRNKFLEAQLMYTTDVYFLKEVISTITMC